MKRIFSTLLCLAACITPANAKEEVTEVIEQTLNFQPGQLLTVESINGHITIQTGTKNQVHILATKKAKANTESEAEEILENTYIEIEPTSNGLEITTKHPPKSMLRRGKNITVTYVITVPQRVTLDLRTTNGKIDITETQGDVTAKTTNGDIETVGTKGTLQAKTTNGGIRLDQIKGGIHASTTNGSVDVDLVDMTQAPIHVQTTNGSIDLTLPSDFKAQLKAQTTNGKISTDFPITIKGRFSGKSINGALNGGGENEISLQTVNGGINIEYR